MVGDDDGGECDSCGFPNRSQSSVSSGVGREQ